MTSCTAHRGLKATDQGQAEQPRLSVGNGKLSGAPLCWCSHGVVCHLRLESGLCVQPKNDNKLEKKTIGHDAFVPGAEKEGEGQDTLAEVKESGNKIVEGIKDAVTGGGKEE